MGKYLVALVVFVALAVEVPAILQKNQRNQDAVDVQVSDDPAVSKHDTRPRRSSIEHENPLAGRFAKIKADSRGHFIANAKLNGRKTKVLVDTGATSVAINRSLARRIGIQLSNSDFKYSVSTANGKAKAASAMIDRVEIGRVVVSRVQAVVLEDRALDSVLLGMTFLNQLEKFEISRGTLLLAQ